MIKFWAARGLLLRIGEGYCWNNTLIFNIAYCTFKYCNILLYCNMMWTLTAAFSTSNEQDKIRKGKLNASCFHTAKKDSQHFLEKDRISPRSPDFQLNWITIHLIHLMQWHRALVLQALQSTLVGVLSFYPFKGSRLSNDSGSSASYFLSSLATISWEDSSDALSLGKMIMP